MCLVPALLLWLASTLNILKAQDFHDFGFERNTTIPVYGFENKSLDLAWAGGLNACQFHSLDINFNGIEDLIIFDRHGNRLLTFINDGTDGEYAFTFAPEYIDLFPACEHWIQFNDFNGNGKKDIFTYTTAGIKVFRNVSDTEIKFEQVTYPFLLTQIGNSLLNLYVTSVDYPAIIDMDSDGDLDILTFWGLGTYLEKHTNLSTENFGHSDSLIYKKTEYCWGRFAESDESNAVTLDTCLSFKSADLLKNIPLLRDNRHVGSTLLMLDMSGNGLKDLILGDIDYPMLFLLKNEGTHDTAFITGLDTLFPSNTRPVNLFSFPVPNFLDITNNGVNDLLVSTFDPSLRRSNHHQSIWFYRNTGTNELPVFEFEREDIFQHRMIDVGANSRPVLVDLDGDGLLDLFVSNYGYNDTCFYDQFYNLGCKYVSAISYYKNTGSLGNPEFTLIEDDFAALSELELKAMHPTFGDIDNDGKLEMISGAENGKLLLFKDQSADDSDPVFVLEDDNFQDIEVSGFSAPQLIDITGNGMLDLVIGQVNGKLSYYENQGTPNTPVFVNITNEFGNVNVTDPMVSYTGHSMPCFFRDASGQLRLFVGSESGKIFYFREIEDNLNGEFLLVEERLLLIREGIRTSPAVGFITGNDYPDLIVGNYSGGLSFYQGAMPRPFGIEDPEALMQNGFDVFPNPATNHLTVILEEADNSLVGMEVFDMTGRLVYLDDKLVTRQTVIPLHSWNTGLYLFQLKFTDMEGNQRINRKKVMIIK